MRVLDNLIWFDWLAVYWEDFRQYVVPDDDTGHHRVTDLGRPHRVDGLVRLGQDVVAI